MLLPSEFTNMAQAIAESLKNNAQAKE